MKLDLLTTDFPIQGLYLSLHDHLVFGRKSREALIEPAWRARLHDDLGGTIRGLEGFPEGIGGSSRCDPSGIGTSAGAGTGGSARASRDPRLMADIPPGWPGGSPGYPLPRGPGSRGAGGAVGEEPVEGSVLDIDNSALDEPPRGDSEELAP